MHTILKYSNLHTIRTLYTFIGEIILSKLKWLKSVQISSELYAYILLTVRNIFIEMGLGSEDIRDVVLSEM